MASLAASMLAFSSTLHLYPFAVNPFSVIAAALFAAASSFKSSNATFAPLAANASAITEQITPPAPVTTATFPVKSTCIGNFMFFPPFFFPKAYALGNAFSTASNNPLIYVAPRARSYNPYPGLPVSPQIILP